MKLLIFSDTHANPIALEAIWNQESDADAVYCAGDLVDYGPFPHEVITWMKEHDAIAVFGNHDRKLLDVYAKYGTDFTSIPPSEYCWVHENCKRLTEEDIEYLAALPEIVDFTADGYRYRMAHQWNETWMPPRTTADFDAFAQNIPGPAEFPIRLIFGHTHRQGIYTMAGDRMWINPGSTYYRQPDDFDKSAHYAIIENGEISLHSLVYDRSPVYDAVLPFAASKSMKEWEWKSALFASGDYIL